VGTGELADSLALEPIVKSAEKFVSFFANKTNALLELKTKSDNIRELLSLPHCGRTVVSWSLNPDEIISREEYNSPPLLMRLECARQVQNAGYLLGFHFDPILHYVNWEAGYKSMIQTLFRKVDSSRVAWISMGSLRFPSVMKEKVVEKFPRSKIAYGELIPGLDGKYRYVKPLRVRMYSSIYRWLRKYGGEDLFIYFCMESPDVWRKVMGFAPESNNHLDYLFAQSLSKRFPFLFKDSVRWEEYQQK
jgi:spore photoproduct lyase